MAPSIPTVRIFNERLELHIDGAVQGVGFRPFVYRLANELGLSGTVSNDPEGVRIAVEGPREVLELFLQRLTAKPPPLCRIVSIERAWKAARGVKTFRIEDSAAAGDAHALILPDIAVCAECLGDISTPADRRYRYPFTNCTHCGPRFSIVTRLPYDRANTSMAGFRMCDDCRAEYEDPGNRRFHAQPTACPACGPRLELWRSDGAILLAGDAALRATAKAVREGRIAAVKGLGGFHLVADARDEAIVARLRLAKRREEKPFALMYPDLASVRADCVVSEAEERLLTSPQSPIVLLRRKPENGLAENVAPDVPALGVMLPYTPLHRLLMDELGFPVVATSGNRREEPICIDEHEALERLGGIADVFLVHNRPIVRPVDDSIARVLLDGEQLIRRARGYAPLPIRVRESGVPVLAVGGHMKNTVALSKGRDIFVSPHVGDLDTPLALDAFAAAAKALEDLYAAPPQRVVHDLHPDYRSTIHARSLGLPALAVQHHFAHVLACMAEHDLSGPVLGVAWDGSGYGPDGTVWGGEFLVAWRDRYTRVAHLRPFRLPGGEAAVLEPRRCALAVVAEALGLDETLAPDLLSRWGFSTREASVLGAMISKNVGNEVGSSGERESIFSFSLPTPSNGLNTPVTTSAGRLFDAVASLLGLRQQCSFEGQAAMALEACAMEHRGPCPNYEMRLDSRGNLDWVPMIQTLVHDVRDGVPRKAMAAGFHAALARGIEAVALRQGIEDVVLTGGCFQNALLLEEATMLLRQSGFRPFRHHRVPTNDGGIALGQALYGLAQAKE